MEGDEVQPTRISEDEYTRFKQWVQDVHGTTRGHLSSEIENALREYRQKDRDIDKLTRIEDDVATIKAQLATVESDGGSSVENVSTPAPAKSKPRANATRDEKVKWVVEQHFTHESGEATNEIFIESVQEEFSFSEDVAFEYIELIAEELDAEQHPKNPEVWRWGK